MTVVHVVVPDGVDDPARPSGGNTYDRRLCAGLAALGLGGARESAVRPENRCGQAVFTASALSEVLAGAPDRRRRAGRRPRRVRPAGGARAEAGRLRLVVLVHLPLGLGGPDGGGARGAGARAAALRLRRRRRDDQPVDPALAARRLRPRPGPGRRRRAGSGARRPAVAGGPAGRRLLCVGAVVPAKGHDVLVEALARVPGARLALHVRRLARTRPGLRRAAARAGRRARGRGPGAVHRPAGRAPRWRPRTPAPTSSSPRRAARRTGWRSPRRSPTASRCWRPGSAACRRPWAGHPAGGDPASSCRPTIPVRSPGRWSSGSATPACGRTCARRPRAGGRRCPPGPPTSAEVARVLAGVAA